MAPPEFDDIFLVCILKEVSKVSAVVFVALLFLLSANATAWKDSSKHVVRFIEVEPGVKLEVLARSENLMTESEIHGAKEIRAFLQTH